MAMRIAIIGCGLIGHKRARTLPADVKLVAVADTNHSRAQQLAGQFSGCEVEPDWQSCIARPDVEMIFVATVNASLAPVTLAAVQRGKHVLVEKPAARRAEELMPIVAAARASGVHVKVGFNHRFHPAFQKARALCVAGELGPLLYIRGRYGHGGRLGYEREWRANPEIAGGGELLDQGVHLIDLSRWFLGDFVEAWGQTATYYWNMPVEDNGFLCLRTASRQTAWLHASCTEWKNLFSFEIFGRDGKLQIDGLGSSYGVERLSFYRMLPQLGPPETTIWEYPGEDQSWSAEFHHFRDCIASGRSPSGTLEDAIASLNIVEQVYRQRSANGEGQVFPVQHPQEQAGKPVVHEPELRKAV